MEAAHFGVLDYSVFGVMLALSALIGVYFAFFAKQKQNTIAEYLMGGKKMGVFPISMSLIASYISGISLLGLPAEMYVFGTQYWLIVFSQLAVCITMACVFLPVFYKLQITSSYEYLNLRFNPTVRLLGTVFFLVMMIFYIPVVVYVPALALNQVTGIDVHAITPLVCGVGIFYTTLGGLKAVVWTDTLQTILMFGGVIIVMVLGTIRVGGVEEVLARSQQTGRLEFFNMDPDPTLRYTFCTALFGSYFYWLSLLAVNQSMVQRCIAMPSLRKANITVTIQGIGTFLVMTLCCFTGLVIYAFYHDCDPLTTKMIKKSDQILPYFVMQTSQAAPGLPGLFVAGVFSAALSSMSTALNSMAGVIFEDLIRPMVKTPFSEQRASTIMKVMSALLGLISVGLVFVVEKLGALIQAVQSLTGIVSGPLLGMFTLGMVFPWANEKGALAGGLASFFFTGWLSYNAQSHASRGDITYPRKPLMVDGCPADVLNNTVFTPFRPTSDDVFWLYRISYLYYTMISVIVTLVVGLLVSWATGPRDAREIPRELLTPLVHRFLPSRSPDTPMEDLHHDKTTAC